MAAPLITVRDVWDEVLPEGTELLGGRAGLGRPADWATSLRTRAPAFDAVKGGEVAFVPVRSIRLVDERLDLGQVMSSLAAKGASAVVASGEVAASDRELADRLALPLFAVAPEVPLGDVQQEAVRFILEQRTLLHERDSTLHRELTELALSRAGVPSIVTRLAEVTGAAAAWHRPDGAVLHLAAPGGEATVPEEVERAAAEGMHDVGRWGEVVAVSAADPPVREFAIPGSDLGRLVAPLCVHNRTEGYVSLLGADGQLGRLSRVAVARAAAACAIELDREHAVLKARDDLEGEFVEALLAASYSSEAAAVERAARLSFGIGGTNAVLAVRPQQGTEPREWPEGALDAARRWARRRGSDILVTLHHVAVCAVAALPERAPEEALSRLASELRVECASAARAPSLSVGMGRPKPGVAGVRASYREAEQALSLGTRLFGGGRVLDFADLGLYRLLSTLAQHPELAAFHEDNLGSLRDYDRRTGSDLLRTLDAFFACHGSPTEMAERLGLHRNTVLYRLRRIEEIGGVDLADPRARLNLHLSLRAGEVLRSTPAGDA